MLKEILNTLNEADRSLLTVAHEIGVEQIIVLPNRFFIGVNVPRIDRYIVIEEKGDWCYGEIVS